MVNANLTLPRGSSAIRFTNGRPSSDLSTATKTIPLYAPNSIYGDRFNQLDLALNKRWDLGVTRLTTSLDLYNALNSASVQQVVSAYGDRTLDRRRRSSCRRACCGSRRR